MGVVSLQLMDYIICNQAPYSVLNNRKSGLGFVSVFMQ